MNLKKKTNFFKIFEKFKSSYIGERIQSYSSEAKAEGLSGARNSIAKKTKMIKKKTVRRRTDDVRAGICNMKVNRRNYKDTTNFVPVKLSVTFLSKFLIFLFLFQPSKNFPHVLHYPNLSKRHSEKFFFEQKFFFQKQLFIFFEFFYFDFFFEFFFLDIFFCLSQFYY